MSEESNISRRGFLGKTAAIGTTALAGCSAPNEQQETSSEEEITAELEETNNTSSSDQEIEETHNEYSRRDLHGTAKIIESELKDKGYGSPSDMPFSNVQYETEKVDSNRIGFNIDLNSIIDNARREGEHHIERDQDFFKLTATNNLDTVYEDLETQLEEVEETVYQNVHDFLDEYGLPEDREHLDVTVNLRGENHTNVSIGWLRKEPGQEPEHRRNLQDVRRDWAETSEDEAVSGLAHSPHRYENLGYMEVGDEITLSFEDEEYTLEPRHTDEDSAVLRINGDLGRYREGDKVLQGQDIVLNDTDPMYMESGVELNFGEDVDYAL